jgi:DNA-binding CsgD family transcriptional regulator
MLIAGLKRRPVTRKDLAVPPAAPTHRAAGAPTRKVDPRAFSLALLESEGRILQLLARGAPSRTVLRELVLAIERLSGDMTGSVLLLAADGQHATHGAAPHLPPSYWKAIDGLRIGPAAGSCGTAMHTRKPVIVEDVASDPLWADYRQLALPHGLRACWSMPILSTRGEVLGAFALYYRQPRRPTQQELRLVGVAAQLAALAIVGARDQPRRSAGDRPQRQLSPRELQILRFIAHGEPVKRIAARLGLTISTIYTHRARILGKLGVDSNVALARYAVLHRLVH